MAKFDRDGSTGDASGRIRSRPDTATPDGPGTGAIAFDIEKLGRALSSDRRDLLFALLHGSAVRGWVNPASDIDIALFIAGTPRFEHVRAAADVVDRLVPGVMGDVGILNTAEPVYRFEALRGRLLFCRDWDRYLWFFSVTCREYESQLADYERQRRYRLQRA